MNLNRRRSLYLGASLLGLPLWSASAHAASLAAVGTATADAPDVTKAFEAFSEQLAEDWIRLSPESATNTQYFGAAEQALLDRQLAPQTLAHRARYTELAKRGLAQLHGWSEAQLPLALRSSAATLRWSLQRQVDNAPFEEHSFLFSQLRGPQVRYAGILAVTHPLLQATQVDAYLARLALVPQRFDEALARTDAAAAKGLLPPRFILERSREQVQAFLKLAPEQSDFVSGLARRSQRTAGLDEAARLAAVSEATRLVKDLQPPAEPDPRPALLERNREAVADAQRRAQPLFDLQPRSPVEVQRVPAATERTASAYYTTPAPDGSRPGIFWAPLPGPQFNLLGMRTLAVHEAVPRHHFQLALQQESQDLPRWRQRRIFGGGSAHSEGWALYSERLAIEQGWYEGDPHGLLGAWDAQLFRARRLVVDTGLHAKRWTRQQGIDYGISAREVERYVANPGQACACMVGMLHILALREEAQEAQGSKFSLPAFHNLVLRTGLVPLAVLSEEMCAWMAA